ncbi:hypothetical protein JCGZ_15248 [Jatropha curcas]|uniref:Arabidopsis retrotransposon Orf1 C-terminal domain-containing protein n=1 Tax=Jatropha curcas TaxID=180498 RepID=A0A067KFB2_JATCU|nr:hypothetical protein JCGZ_15248 [Jatropha curcas]
MPPRYKRCRPASSVAARKRPTVRSSMAPQTPSPPALPFEFASSEQQERYNKLSFRPVLPNRFIDEAALAQVSLRDVVIEPLRRIGWCQFIEMKDLVYAPLTLEFLSSYSSFIRFLPDSRPSKIRFRLMGRNFELSVNEVSHIFGFPTENAQIQVPSEFNACNTWNRFTDEVNYNPRYSKASKLKNPALRYLHKFLSNTIFGRSESDGALSLNELSFLWAIERGILLNVGYWLCQRFARVARAEKGAIMMGCFATRIHRYLQVWNPTRPVHDSVGGGKGTRLDLDVMIHMKLIEKVGDAYRVVGAREGNSDDETEAAGGADMEEDNPPPFTSSFGAGTSDAGPSVQGASNMSNDEVLARMMARMDLFDTRLNGMETMIADRFQSIEIMNGSLDSRMDTMQGQLQTILQLLQPPPPPED